MSKEGRAQQLVGQRSHEGMAASAFSYWYDKFSRYHRAWARKKTKEKAGKLSGDSSDLRRESAR